MTIETRITEFINRAQTKIRSLGSFLSLNFDNSAYRDQETLDQLIMAYEFRNFVEALLSENRAGLTDQEVEDLIGFFWSWGELQKVAVVNYTSYQSVFQENVQVPAGTYALQADLVAEIQARISGDQALSARVLTLEQNQLDPGTLFPPGFFDNLNTSNSVVFDDDTRLHTHANKPQIDAITQLLLNDLLALAAHYASVNSAGALHITAAERTFWNGKVDLAALAALSSVYAPISHVQAGNDKHTISQITSLQAVIDQLNADIAAMAGQDGREIELQSDGDLIEWRYVGEATWIPLGNFKGDQGIQGNAFTINARGLDTGRLNSLYDNQNDQFTYLAENTGMLYYRRPAGGPATNPAGWANPIPFLGQNGWSPVLAIYEFSADKSVYELIDWIGGSGTKPVLDPGANPPNPVRWFLGPSGFVLDPVIAINVKGPRGNTGSGPIIGAVGNLAGRAAYNNSAAGFIYLRNDVSPQTIYIKNSDAPGDWGPQLPWQGPIGPTGVLPFEDNVPLLQNAADNTKLARFSLANIPTGTSLVFNLPAHGGNILVGGGENQLGGNTDIIGGGTAHLRLGTTASRLSSFEVRTAGGGVRFEDNAGGGVLIQETGGGGIILESTGVGGIFFESKGGTASIVGSTAGGVLRTRLDFSESLARFTDTRVSPQGLTYNADGYVTTDRSLTDRGYVLGAKTFTGRQTFASGDDGSLVVGSHTTDHTTSVNGLIYYNTTANELRARINGAWVALGAGGGSAWLLASGGTLTNVNTIISNAANQLNYTGTFTATANNQHYQNFSGNITGTATGADNLFHTVINPTMTAGANSQILTAVHIDPTFNTGSFTGVLSNPLVVGPISQPWFRVRSGAHLFGNSVNANAITFSTGGADSFITFSGANAGIYNHTGAGRHVWQQNGTDRFWVGNLGGVVALGLFADGATATSTTTQRSGFPQISRLSMWNGAEAVTRSWVYRSTASTSVNDESFFDIGYASGGGVTIDGIRLRTSSTGTHLIGSSADVPTASVRLDVRGTGTDNTTSAARWANSANTQLMRLFNGGSLLLGGTTLTNNNTILDIQSTTQGVAFPRMTNTQRDAITGPYSGLQIHSTTSNRPNWYNGTSWQEAAGRSDLGSFLTGSLTASGLVETNGLDFEVGDLAGSRLFTSAGTAGLITDFVELTFTDGDASSAALFTDNRTNKEGIQYAAAGYVTTDRSLTDRGFVLGPKTFTGRQTFATGNNGSLVVGTHTADDSSPVNGLIMYNTTSNTFRFRQNGAWVGLGGGGITNSAANNELMKSDGTNAIGSGISSTTDGQIIMGLSSTAGAVRTFTADGSAANVGINFSGKGNGALTFVSGGSTRFNIANNQIGFFGATPVAQQGSVTTAQGIADALTAYGLLQTSTIINNRPAVTTVSSNTTISVTGSEQIVRGDTTSANVTTTLPTAVGITGHRIIFKRISGGTNTWTIDANSTETIDGALTAVLTTQYESITIFSNGTNWEII